MRLMTVYPKEAPKVTMRKKIPMRATEPASLRCSTEKKNDAVQGADAVVMLRIQHERIGDPLIPGTREYSKFWGLNEKKAAEWLTPSCCILHPGPINRGVELSPEVADGPRSVILDQVENGVAVRMAILYLLAGGAAKIDAVEAPAAEGARA